MCQVIFKAQGITSVMVPSEAAEKISNLLISTAENGISTYQTFLTAAQEFGNNWEQKGVQCPVVLLSDGHSSRLNHNVFTFLLNKQIQASMFTDFNILNREALMLILANNWDKWVLNETLVNAARKVGITAAQLSMKMMQLDKFARATKCMNTEDESSASTSAFNIFFICIGKINSIRG